MTDRRTVLFGGGGVVLAYAPPFNTTWDPVLTAAKVLGSQF